MVNLDMLVGLKSPGGERTAKQLPQKGAARFFYLAYTHFAKLVGANMLFLLFCVPVVTIPAALSGMNRVCILLVREGTCSVWRDFILEFKNSFLKSLPVGALCAFLFADAALCAFLGLAGASVFSAALFISALILFIFAVLLSCTSSTIMSLVSLKSGDILRDAVSLILRNPVADLYLLIFVGGGIAAAVAFLPFSVPVIAVIWPSFLSLAASMILNGPIQNCIINAVELSS